MTSSSDNRICVVVVAFNAEAFILDCIASVLSSEGPDVRLVVVDNGSTDGTRMLIQDWAAGTRPHVPSSDAPIEISPLEERPALEVLAPGQSASGPLKALTLVASDDNGGFAAGVNLGLRVGLADQSVKHFWVLNPDSVTTRHAAAAFLEVASKTTDYGLITGRACYYHDPEMVQIDGGLINRWTGVTSNANVGNPVADATMPDGADLDFAFGGNMMVSRAFVETCGEMPEDYFLYYEEVDWSLKRRDFPMLTSKDALIYHRAGASIGSPIFGGRGASPFSLYFKHRARMMFVRRFLPMSWPIAALYTLAKAAQSAVAGDISGASAILKGGFGMSPPRTVAERLQASALSRIGVAARA